MAVQLAEREAAVGVRASYYFRCDGAGRFPEDACRRIAGLGHETGYHYEDLSRCGGDRATAIESFRRNLAALRKLAPCITVSMHGSPLSTHDNRQLLNASILAEQGLVGDVSTGLESRKFLYFTDAGGRWNDVRLNRRDRMGIMPEGIDPLDMGSLEGALCTYAGLPLVFNLHPERWTTGVGQFLAAALRDAAAAAAKTAWRIM